MNKYLKEAIWFCILLFLAFSLIQLPTSVIDLGSYDSYFVIHPSDFFMPCLIITGFIIYFIRTLILKYNNTICNIIFLVFNSAIIYTFTQLILFINRMTIKWSVYQSPDTKLTVIPENPFLLFLKCFQVFLIVLLAFSAFRTGQKFNTQKNEK